MVLHIAGVYGGAERTTVNLLAHMDPGLFSEVTIAASECVLDSLVDRNNYTKLDLTTYRLRGWFQGLFSFVSDIFQVRRLIKKESPDVVLSVMHYAATLSAFACAFPGVRATATVSSLRGPAHEHLKRYERGLIRGRAIRLALRCMTALSTRVVVPSAGTKKELVRYFGAGEAKVDVIANSIDVGKVAILRQEAVKEDWLFSRPDHPVICVAARLAKEKNIDLLIRAVALVRKELSCHLLILGSGPEQSGLQELANELQIAESVTFLGHQKNVFSYIDRSTVFLHSCIYEGFGYSILEAMACGTPVIATDCPYGPREILGDDEHGLLCSMSDVNEMVRLIKRVLQDSEIRRRYAHAGIQRAGQYSMGRMASSYHSVFGEIISTT